MNRKVKEKLNSKRGASVVLALFLLLVCTFAGTSALTAARANVGRYSTMRETQQDYLSVTSAAKLIIADLQDNDQNVKGTISSGSATDYVTYYGDETSTFYHFILDDIKTLMHNKAAEDVKSKGGAWSSFKSETKTFEERNFTLKIDGKDEFGEVDVSFKIDSGGSAKVKLTCGSYSYSFAIGIGFIKDGEISDSKASYILNVSGEIPEIRPEVS